MIDTDPAEGALVAPDTAISARVRLGGAPAADITLTVDGVDMTDRCSVRTDLAHPPLRADVSLAGPIGPGEHRIVLGFGPRRAAHAWRFSVERTEDDSRIGRENR